MILNISPGVLISMIGMIGLMLTFIDNTGFVGSKIPITIFFLVIMVLGILYEAYPKDKLEGIYGEVPGNFNKKDFS